LSGIYINSHNIIQVPVFSKKIIRTRTKTKIKRTKIAKIMAIIRTIRATKARTIITSTIITRAKIRTTVKQVQELLPSSAIF